MSNGPSRLRAALAFRAREARNVRAGRRIAARMGSVGEGVSLAADLALTGATEVVLEDNVHVGTGAFVRAEGGLFIGANTHISRNLVLYTMNHDHRGSLLPYDHNQVGRPVHIGRNVWIGMNVCIVAGTTIGDGAVIGMGTVVSGEVPPMAIIGSQPWRVIGHRDEEHYRKLDEAGRYGGRGGHPFDCPRPGPGVNRTQGPK